MQLLVTTAFWESTLYICTYNSKAPKVTSTVKKISQRYPSGTVEAKISFWKHWCGAQWVVNQPSATNMAWYWWLVVSVSFIFQFAKILFYVCILHGAKLCGKFSFGLICAHIWFHNYYFFSLSRDRAQVWFPTLNVYLFHWRAMTKSTCMGAHTAINNPCL